MSAKTVEAHLASVYRKLGIRSRAELGARMAALAHQEPTLRPGLRPGGVAPFGGSAADVLT